MARRVLLVFVCLVAILSAVGVGLPAPRADSSPEVAVNEVAWGGTAANPADEWIELANNSARPVDLTGWTLTSNDGSPEITLQGTIPARGYYLLERTDDQTISDIPADQTYTGALTNAGEGLTLKDASGAVVDTANGDGGGWPAGTASGGSLPYASMERRDSQAADGDGNWRTNDGQTRNGLDVEGNPINGTPKAPNSASTATTPTPSPSPTGSPTPLPSDTPTPTFTPTLTPTPTLTGTVTPTVTFTSTSTPLLPSSPTPTPSVTPTTTSTTEPWPRSVVINEVFYDAPSEWPEPEDEWFELCNVTDQDIDLGHWSVEDNSDQFVFPEGTVIPARGYVVLAYDGTSFAAHWGFEPLSYGPSAGNLRLANNGDRLILRAPTGGVADGMSYGHDGSALNPPCVDVPAGHSLEREPAGFDSDQAADFVERENPSPGGAPPTPPTPTPSSTPTPIPAAAPLVISEVCYDGIIPDTEGDEFVELANPLSYTVGLAGYKIGDEETRGGSEGMYHLPITGSIDPGEVVLVAKNAAQFRQRFGFWPDLEMRVSGDGYEDTPTVANLERCAEWGGGSWALSNAGDEVLLLGPGDVVVDAAVFKSGDGEALRVSGTLSAPEPRSLQRVMGPDHDDMPADFAIDEPSPARLILAPTPPPSPPASLDLGAGMYAYWGCLHSHSTYSDGSGPPRYAYAVGRANGLHFLALSDHSHMYDAQQWADLSAQAAAATENGAFVGLRGFEWTSREAGHISVLNAVAWVSRDAPPYDTLPGFYSWLGDQEGAIAQFNHAFAGDFADLAYDPAAGRRISLLEVGNGNGAGYSRFEEAYVRSLGAGWRVGPVNNADTQMPEWGADTAHRTGLVAPSLTQMDVLDALERRRVFATEDSNMALVVRAGDLWMGETLSTPGELTLTVSYWDADGEHAEVALYERSLLMGVADLAAGSRWITSVKGLPGHFYWARAEQPDGDLAYTSPIWVAGQAPLERVLLNEFCPAPRDVDWDESGTASADDEWIELYNAEDHPVGLGGWQIDDEAQGGSARWTFPLGWTLPSHGYLVLFKHHTGVALNDSGGLVRLLHPDGSLADEMSYSHSPGYDRTWSRTEDGRGEWTAEYEPTMGQANKYEREGPPPEEQEPGAVPIPLAVTVAQARLLPAGTLIIVQGQVAAPPGVLKGGTIYVQDVGSGMKVYLSDGAYPPLEEGDWVRVEGELSDYHGEREITISSTAKVQWLGVGQPPRPVLVETGELGEGVEGLLVELVGRVTGWGWDAVYLDDGSGQARVYFGRSELAEKPWVEKGELYLVVGVVSQYASARPYEGGYRLLPRYARDVIFAPAELPVTGGGLRRWAR